MIKLKFDTYNHNLEFTYDGETTYYENVMTIKVHEDCYQVLQRQESSGKNAPLLKLPIDKTIIEYIHE